MNLSAIWAATSGTMRQEILEKIAADVRVEVREGTHDRLPDIEDSIESELGQSEEVE
jgi:hypothetical protein